MISRPRVLVIDDDPLFRSLITSMLRRDFLVTVAGDGAEGYYKALEFPPQLAIIDIQMPGWDGLRTLQAMQAHKALANIPVMMLTSDATRQTVLAAIQAGAKDYVIKTTLNRDDLLTKASRLINLGNSKSATEESKAPNSPPSPTMTRIPHLAQPAPSRIDGLGAADAEAAALQAMVDNWE
jgi:DNA-binding response OmpR family regulator